MLLKLLETAAYLFGALLLVVALAGLPEGVALDPLPEALRDDLFTGASILFLLVTAWAAASLGLRKRAKVGRQ